MTDGLLSEKENAAARAFMLDHPDECPKGGVDSVEIVAKGNNIGVNVMVRCPLCGRGEDITDWETW